MLKAPYNFEFLTLTCGYREKELEQGLLDHKKQIYKGFNRHAIEMTDHDEKFESIAFIAMDSKVFAGDIVVEQFLGNLHVKRPRYTHGTSSHYLKKNF